MSRWGLLASQTQTPIWYSQPRIESSALTFFTQGSLLSPFFFFFSIATCVWGLSDEVARVSDWEPCALERSRLSRPDHFTHCLFSLCPYPPRQLQPSLDQPCAGKHNAINCFPFLCFVPPSLQPLYSYLIVNCSRDWLVTENQTLALLTRQGDGVSY